MKLGLNVLLALFIFTLVACESTTEKSNDVSPLAGPALVMFYTDN